MLDVEGDAYIRSQERGAAGGGQGHADLPLEVDELAALLIVGEELSCSD